MQDRCEDNPTPCQEEMTVTTDSSQCATAESCNDRLSPVESVSKTAKCPSRDPAQQKSAKELAKVKKREDKGIGNMCFVH